MNRIRKFLKSEDAIAITEYGLLFALIAVVLIAAVAFFGTSISAWFTTHVSQVTTT
jgi:Flp pilus assembly pilin Flp